MAAGSVRPSYESLQEKLLVSAGYKILHLIIDKDALLNGPEIVHTGILIVNMKVALC